MLNFIKSEFAKSRETFELIEKDNNLHKQIEKAAEICVKSLKSGGKIMFCGNGGSAADAQHLAAELVCRLTYDRPAIAALALTTDTSALTAISNDYYYSDIFSRQVEALGKAEDILIGISTSGRSENILKAVKIAKTQKIKTIGFLGEDGRDVGEEVDFSVNIPSGITAKIQEAHISTGHILCGIIQHAIFEERK